MKGVGASYAAFSCASPARRAAISPPNRSACAIATGLAIGGGYAELAAVSTGARLLVYFACCLACLRLPAAGSAGRGRVVPILTAGAIAALLPGLERREVVAGMIGILIGPVLYLAARRERRVLASEEECP